MKRVIKKKSSIYCYLNSTKVLETGSDQDIAIARKEYWKAYKAEWRKTQRQKAQEFSIKCTLQEAKEIETAAKQHGISKNRFIKQACFGYMRKRYVPLDPYSLATIRLTLGQNCIALQTLFNQNLLPYDVGKRVITLMETLEAKVLFELHNPKEVSE